MLFGAACHNSAGRVHWLRSSKSHSGRTGCTRHLVAHVCATHWRAGISWTVGRQVGNISRLRSTAHYVCTCTNYFYFNIKILYVVWGCAAGGNILRVWEQVEVTTSYIIPSPPFFQNGTSNPDVRCGLHPSALKYPMGGKHVSNPELNHFTRCIYGWFARLSLRKCKRRGCCPAW